jgi:hypothetical protein
MGQRGPKGARAGKIWRSKNRKVSYRQIMIDGLDYYEHRLAWLYMTGTWPKIIIDHRDLDGLNNKWLNIREATYSQNMANQSTPCCNSTGYKGVSFNKDMGRYTACIGYNGEQTHLGTFDTAELAAAAYEKAARELFGEFARAS